MRAYAYETLADEIRVMAARPAREAYENHQRAAVSYADFMLGTVIDRDNPPRLFREPERASAMVAPRRAAAKRPRALPRKRCPRDARLPHHLEGPRRQRGEDGEAPEPFSAWPEAL